MSPYSWLSISVLSDLYRPIGYGPMIIWRTLPDKGGCHKTTEEDVETGRVVIIEFRRGRLASVGEQTTWPKELSWSNGSRQSSGAALSDLCAEACEQIQRTFTERTQRCRGARVGLT